MKNAAIKTEKSKSERSKRITADFVLDHYLEAQQCKDPEEHAGRMKTVILLSKNIGSWYSS